jgi:hypothetical protein
VTFPSLPNVGDLNWGPPLNTAITAVETALNNEITNRTTADANHVAASDPHHDRSYADGAVSSGVSAHSSASDPHADRTFATNQINGHTTATDPHGDRSFTTTSLNNHIAATDPHGDRNYVYSTLRGNANGLASLDGSRLIPKTQLPQRNAIIQWQDSSGSFLSNANITAGNGLNVVNLVVPAPSVAGILYCDAQIQGLGAAFNLTCYLTTPTTQIRWVASLSDNNNIARVTFQGNLTTAHATENITLAVWTYVSAGTLNSPGDARFSFADVSFTAL